MSDKQTVLNALTEKFGGQVSVYAGDETVILPAENLVAAATALHTDHRFELLSDVTAVDYWPEESPRFHVVYRFTSVSGKMVLNVRVPVAAIEPVVPTLEKIYRSANWYEREIFDMFGIKFEGHSDMRRIIMPFDWQGHPLRKDYPLGYEEPQYTFNYDDVLVNKPAGKRMP